MERKRGISLIVLLLIVVIIVVIVTGVILVLNKKPEENVTDNNTENNIENVVEENKNEVVEESKEEEFEMLKLSSFSKNFKFIECSYSSEYYSDDEGVTNFIYKDKKFIYGMRVDAGVTQEPFSGNLEDVISYTINSSAIEELTYGINMSFNKEKGLDIVSSEKVKVGDNDCIKYTGKIYSVNGKENFYYCYAMIMDETPTVVFGFVYDESQSEELKNEAIKCTDELVKTIEVK